MWMSPAERVDEEFDIVVLSVGLMVSPQGCGAGENDWVLIVDHYNFAAYQQFRTRRKFHARYLCLRRL